MSTQMLGGGPQTRTPIDDSSRVGECRRKAQRLAEAHGFATTDVGRVGIVATELANNVANHASRGEFLLQVLGDGPGASIEMVAIDRGPGMHVDTCMRDGYSTAGTAGTGLGAISRLSSMFDVYSIIGQGTVAVSRISKQPFPVREDPAAAFGAVCIAVAGEIDCGDTWRIAQRDDALAVMVCDGLGHGSPASLASQAAAQTFGQNPFDRPSEAMQRLHTKLAGGRGAAAAVAVLDRAKANVTYAGIGNVAGSIVSSDRSKGMVSHNGILGVQFLRSQQFDYEFREGSWIVMHSDGMSARWSFSNYPGLSVRHASVIAAVLYRDHARPRDDVTVVVARSIT